MNVRIKVKLCRGSEKGPSGMVRVGEQPWWTLLGECLSVFPARQMSQLSVGFGLSSASRFSDSWVQVRNKTTISRMQGRPYLEVLPVGSTGRCPRPGACDRRARPAIPRARDQWLHRTVLMEVQTSCVCLCVCDCVSKSDRAGISVVSNGSSLVVSR